MTGNYRELLDTTAFLASVLNEIAYGAVHESGDIPGEGCDCLSNYAKAALECSYEDFITWKGKDSMWGWVRGSREESKGEK